MRREQNQLWVRHDYGTWWGTHKNRNKRRGWEKRRERNQEKESRWNKGKILGIEGEKRRQNRMGNTPPDDDDMVESSRCCEGEQKRKHRMIRKKSEHQEDPRCKREDKRGSSEGIYLLFFQNCIHLTMGLRDVMWCNPIPLDPQSFIDLKDESCELCSSEKRMSLRLLPLIWFKDHHDACVYLFFSILCSIHTVVVLIPLQIHSSTAPLLISLFGAASKLSSRTSYSSHPPSFASDHHHPFHWIQCMNSCFSSCPRLPFISFSSYYFLRHFLSPELLSWRLLMRLKGWCIFSPSHPCFFHTTPK